MGGMKAISASIVVLAGAIILCAAALCQHDDTNSVIGMVGFLVAVVGISGWIGAIIGKID
jgi:hypothetical protein